MQNVGLGNDSPDTPKSQETLAKPGFKALSSCLTWQGTQRVLMSLWMQLQDNPGIFPRKLRIYLPGSREEHVSQAIDLWRLVALPQSVKRQPVFIRPQDPGTDVQVVPGEERRPIGFPR